MLEEIENGDNGVSYVLVFKLSRFGRNAADVLSSLQLMQDYGVNLICVEDGIDSSKEAGKRMISVLSAAAEIERGNILVQTMEGRRQKAREGRWNGGFDSYGNKLVNALKKKVGTKTDTEELEKERDICRTKLRQAIGAKNKLADQMDFLDVSDRFYDRKYDDMQERMNKLYEEIGAIEDEIDTISLSI